MKTFIGNLCFSGEKQRNTKFEARNPKQARMPKILISQTNKSLGFWNLNFGFVSNFDIRISDFVIGNIPRDAEMTSP